MSKKAVIDSLCVEEMKKKNGKEETGCFHFNETCQNYLSWYEAEFSKLSL